MEIIGLGHEATDDSKARFRFWHVEPLLNQAADLLDRCLRMRQEFYALNVQWAEMQNEQLRYEARVEENALRKANPVLHRYAYIQAEQGLSAVRGMTAHIREARRGALEHWQFLTTSAEDTLKQRLSAGAELHVKDVGILQNERAIKEKETEVKYANADLLSRERQLEFDANLSRRLRKAMSTVGDPLNLEPRINELRLLIEEDFKDAYDRMSVASVGLSRLYGYTAPVPNNNVMEDEPVIESALWVRRSIRWLTAFKQLDQEWTVIFSLSALMGGNLKGTSSDDGKSLVFECTVPIDFFLSHTYARLRGISVVVNCSKAVTLPWSASVKLPRLAGSIQANDGSFSIRPIDQYQIPSCFIGRVEGRQSMRPPELAGAVSLMNASPIGAYGAADAQWQITLKLPHGNGNVFDDLLDVELELKLAGRPDQNISIVLEN